MKKVGLWIFQFSFVLIFSCLLHKQTVGKPAYEKWRERLDGGTMPFTEAFVKGDVLLTTAGQSWIAVNNGLTDRYVHALAGSGNNLFAGTLHGAFISTNNGQSWLTINNGLPDSPVYSLVVSGTNLFAGTFGSGVYLSTNNGQSWRAVNTGLDDLHINALTVSGDTLFAGTAGRGVFRSTNNGSNWISVNTGLDDLYINALAASGSNLYAVTVGSGVFLSTNNGLTWRAVNTGLTFPGICSVLGFAVNGNNLFAGTNGCGLYRSTNNGQNWTAVSSSLTNYSITSLVTSGNDIFAGTYGGGVYLSTDNGQSWTTINSGLSGRNVLSLTLRGNLIYAGTDGDGAFKGTGFFAGAATTISAASYAGPALAAESIAATFGVTLATATQAVSTLPLPTTLAGTTVKVKDSAGTERFAPLFFVAPEQINFQLPAGTATGTATITVTSSDGSFSIGTVQVGSVAPGLFAANANGLGVAAGYALRVGSDSSQQIVPISSFNSSQSQFVTVPVDLGLESDQVFLVLFGTGLRFRTALSNVTATIGGTVAEVTFAGAQGTYVGLDQVNVLIPRSLAGRGEVDIVLTVDGKPANTVRVNIKGQ